jgi:hypothetical protein
MIHGSLRLAIPVYQVIPRLLDDETDPTHDRSYADKAASRPYASPASSGAAF